MFMLLLFNQHIVLVFQSHFCQVHIDGDCYVPSGVGPDRRSARRRSAGPGSRQCTQRKANSPSRTRTYDLAVNRRVFGIADWLSKLLYTKSLPRFAAFASRRILSRFLASEGSITTLKWSNVVTQNNRLGRWAQLLAMCAHVPTRRAFRRVGNPAMIVGQWPCRECLGPRTQRRVSLRENLT